MTTKASAPGKVILLGEHAAVYGNPVLVATVDLKCHVSVRKLEEKKIFVESKSEDLNFKISLEYPKIPKIKKEKRELSLVLEAIERIPEFLEEKESGWEINIFSEIPIASGLGSSASLASALVLAMSKELGYELKKKEIANLAWKIEHIIHGKSSGVDPFAVTFGGIMRYKRGDFQRVKVEKYPEITIGNTGIISDTGKVVTKVMELKEKYPKFFDLYLKAMVEIIDYGQKFLEEGNLEKFGEIMNINHGLLSSIGVSSPELDKLVWTAREAGSLGAKLCGAGQGGIMIALGDVSKEIWKAGGKVIKTKISEEGFRIEL